MPLAFQSRSHGTVAFGFFNIETDLLLLEQTFVFADRFCEAVTQVAAPPPASPSAAAPAEGGGSRRAGAAGSRATLDGWHLTGELGDLHGAIAGRVLTGLIGALYRRFPFPARPEEFRQSPEGFQTQATVRELIRPYTRPAQLALEWDRSAAPVTLAAYTFAVDDFARLVAYVDRGGYPRWRDDVRPPYVAALMRQLAAWSSPLVGTGGDAG